MQRLLFAVFLVSALVAINHIGTSRADVSSLTSERKINLEDIERDTLINEIRSKSQETLQAEPTEHISPTAAAGPGSQVQHHVQHHQHGPTGAPPTASGGAVSHQTIVYHQEGEQQHHHQPTAPAPTQAYHSGITYAQSAPATPQYPQSAPDQFHYSHSAPGAPHPSAAVQYVQQPIAHGHPHVLPQHQPVVYYSHHAHYPQEAVQYVTFQPQHQQYAHHVPSNLIAPTVPQVHEDGRTYAAPSRHTLETNTQQQKYFKSQPPRGPLAFRPKQQNLISPQPQYVYVQAGNAASPQQQRQYQQKLQQVQPPLPPSAGPQRVQNVEIVQSQGHQVAPVEYVPQQSTVQSTPFYQYSGSFGHPQPQSLPANNYVVVPYANGPNVYHHHQQQQQYQQQQYHQQQQQQQQQSPEPPTAEPSPAPVLPTLAAQPIVPEIPHYVHPTKPVIPSGPPPPQVYYPQPHPTHSFVGPSHPQAYPTVSYAPSYPTHGLNFNHGHNYNYYTPSLDFFGQYSRHTSLLDSYVPSSVIYNKARQIYNPYFHHHSHGPSPIIPQGHAIESEHSPIYNTIAYSTEQKPVVVPAPPSFGQPTKRESTVLKAAAAPVKPTALTKIQSVPKKN